MKIKSTAGAIILAVLMTLLGFTTGGAANAVSLTPTQPDLTQVQPAKSAIIEASSASRVAKVRVSCSSGRCTVKLTNQETRDLGAGRIKPIAFPHPALTVAYNASAVAHRFFASYYGSRGWCSQFVLSIYPWESQGYMRATC